jgi:hypothetical protein
LKVYKKVEEDAAEEDDPMVGFTERLQGIVDRLRKAEVAAKGGPSRGT